MKNQKIIMLALVLWTIQSNHATENQHPPTQSQKQSPSQRESESLFDLAKKGILTLLEGIAQSYTASITLRCAIAAPDGNSARPSPLWTSKEVVDQEQALFTARQPRIQASLKNFIGIDIPTEELPSIGYCFSGGGARAMFETIGWLSGAEKLGILDAARYVTGLSGSTWALNPWIASGLSLEEYKKQLSSRFTKALKQDIPTIDMQKAAVSLLRKFYSGQSLSMVDIYGMFLASLLLDGLAKIPNPYEIPLSSLYDQVKNGTNPLVISTAVVGGHMQSSLDRIPFEFSPLASGSFETGSFIPTWAIGRAYQAGNPIQPSLPDLFKPEFFALDEALGTVVSQETAAEIGQIINSVIKTGLCKKSIEHYYGIEPSLGYIMGICGSAFCVDMYNILLYLYNSIKPSSDLLFPVSPTTEQGALILLKKVLSDLIAQVAAHLSQDAADLAKLFAQDADTIKNMQDMLTRWAEHPEKISDYLAYENFAAAKVTNYMAGIVGNPLASLESLPLVDGGFQTEELKCLNIAIIPLLQRKTDLIVICDSSKTVAGAPALKAAAVLAQKMNLSFPQIPETLYTEIDKKQASIIADEENLSAPVIVYMPCIANAQCGLATNLDPVTAEFTGTLNFTYTPEQSTQLMELISFNVTQSAPVLKQAFAKAVERKKKK